MVSTCGGGSGGCMQEGYTMWRGGVYWAEWSKRGGGGQHRSAVIGSKITLHKCIFLTDGLCKNIQDKLIVTRILLSIHGVMSFVQLG